MDANIIELKNKLGEQEFFRQLVDRYKAYIFAVILRYVNDNDIAQDIAQETFIRAHSKLSEYRGGNMRIWLGRIAANLAIDYIRSSKETLEYSEETLGGRSCEGVEADIERKEMHERLNEAIDSLDDIYSSVLRMYYFEEFSYKDIAQNLGISEKTVETRLYRARKILKEELQYEN